MGPVHVTNRILIRPVSFHRVHLLDLPLGHGLSILLRQVCFLRHLSGHLSTVLTAFPHHAIREVALEALEVFKFARCQILLL